MEESWSEARFYSGNGERKRKGEVLGLLVGGRVKSDSVETVGVSAVADVEPNSRSPAGSALDICFLPSFSVCEF